MEDLVLRLCGLGIERKRTIKEITQSVHKYQARLNYKIEVSNEELVAELIKNE